MLVRLGLHHFVTIVCVLNLFYVAADVTDPLASRRDGISLAKLLQGNKEALANPDWHRVGILIEKPGTTGGQDT